MEEYKTAESKRAFILNKTKILSDDGLVWTAVFIDWLDGVELFYWSFELIGLIEYQTIESFVIYLI